MEKHYSIIFYDELDSTMDAAYALTKQKIEKITFVLAKRQRAGRGRKKNKWYSPEGGLWGTIILPTNENYNAEILRFVHYVTALIVVKALEQLYEIKLSIKWPNDIYYNGRKVGGILIEYITGEKNYLLIGIGINANNSFKHSDESEDLQLKKIATSLYDITNKKQRIRVIAKAIVMSFIDEFEKLLKNKKKIVMEFNRKLNSYNKELNVQEKKGICKGINDKGLLILQDEKTKQQHMVDISY